MAVAAYFEVGSLMAVEPALLVPELTTDFPIPRAKTACRGQVLKRMGTAEWCGTGNKM